MNLSKEEVIAVNGGFKIINHGFRNPYSGRSIFFPRGNGMTTMPIPGPDPVMPCPKNNPPVSFPSITVQNKKD